MHDRPLIALLTDFGHRDPYVGQMKASILRDYPDAAIVDLCHHVTPHRIGQAAFFLASSRAHFPPETIFVCVVDPGVGSERSIVCIRIHDQFCIAPDNGLVSLLLGTTPRPPVMAWTVDMSRFPDAGATFHGRDVFAPVAAKLAKGADPDTLGPSVTPDDLMQLQWPQPSLEGETLRCRVLHIDRFGNAVLDLPVDRWKPILFSSRELELLSPCKAVVLTVSTYADLPPGPDHAGILAGSQGHLEIACNGASAAKSLGLAMEEPLTFRCRP